ncbi:MAG TPA: class I SAM-dependent methyltransferase [Desulfuromonadaceae bacterium]|jgi:hypothetical protein
MTINSPTNLITLRGPVPLAHLILGQFLQQGGQAADATCGNGQDTLFLADQVGATGMVWAFDIQEEAISTTVDRLARAGLAGQVKMLHCGHEKISEYVPATLNAVVFNLGYRPGGDRSIITRPETTLAALEKALQLLLPQGILTATVYPGHAGGACEGRMVEAWADRLEPGQWHVWRMGQLNVATDAPYLILVQKGVGK